MNLGFKTQRTIYFILIGLILLNLPIHFFLVRPEVEADASEKSRIEAVGLELKRRASDLNALRAIENRIIDSRKAYNEFTQHYLFSKETGSSELLNELDQLCLQAGLTRNRSTFKHEDESQFGMRRVTLNLPIEGSYANIRKFLNTLEGHPRFIIVESMTLDSEREGTGLIRMEVKLLTLFGGHP